MVRNHFVKNCKIKQVHLITKKGVRANQYFQRMEECFISCIFVETVEQIANNATDRMCEA